MLVPFTPIIIDVVPAFAAVLPVNVIVALSFPDAARFTLLSVAVTPTGKALKVRLVGTSRPPSSVIVTVIEPAAV